jgi:hypothetical protein
MNVLETLLFTYGLLIINLPSMAKMQMLTHTDLQI